VKIEFVHLTPAFMAQHGTGMPDSESVCLSRWLRGVDCVRLKPGRGWTAATSGTQVRL
jgi:hypothetical protein